MRGSRIVVFSLAVLAAGSTGLMGQEGARPDLTGFVVSSSTEAPISGAWIQLQNDVDLGTYSRNDGSFLIPGVPTGSQAYTFQALAYRDATVTLDAAQGSHGVELTPDPVLLPRLNALMEQMKNRRSRAGRVSVFDRADLAFDPERLSSRTTWTLSRFLDRHLMDAPVTVCLDEAPGGYEALKEEPQSFYMVEALEHGRILRLYTEDFIRSLLVSGKGLGAKATLPFSC